MALDPNSVLISAGPAASGRQPLKAVPSPPTPFYNDTGVELPAGANLNAFGNNAATGEVKAILLDASSPQFSSAPIGFTLEAVPYESSGQAYKRGQIPQDLTGFDAGGIVYADPDPGNKGGVTATKPLEPDARIIIGSPVVVGASGILETDIMRNVRRNASASYHFSSQGIGAGNYDKSGFYDWVSASVALNQGSPSVVFGDSGRTYAAHPGVVPQAAGTANGVCALTVTGIKDSETVPQVTGQTDIIIDDIRNLTADELAEAIGKYSGDVTFALVPDDATTYALTCNYGTSKYLDAQNQDFTITGFDFGWLAAFTDSTSDIKLYHHKKEGWTYAATGFTPGDGTIAERLVDQAEAPDLVSGESGAWKRSGLNHFIQGGDSEGLIIQVSPASNNTFQTLDLNVFAVSEALT